MLGVRFFAAEAGGQLVGVFAGSDGKLEQVALDEIPHREGTTSRRLLGRIGLVRLRLFGWVCHERR
jgi:hypothetical protein